MIFGVETKQPLPDGWTPLEAVAVIKCLDEDGDPTLYLAATEALSSWESLGMLTAARDAQAGDVQARFIEEDDED